MLPGIREKKGRDMGQKRKKINGKELVLDISYDIVGSVLYALGIYTLQKRQILHRADYPVWR